ncbi:MAG: hypothetical protein A4E49_00484 [Methanosaeta sp. PtaU1.Bin112]|nr:MAG: hypothetical protein A4E49_00484 [Methanosaeta sp. PtaU1.Bin112]
MRRNGGTNQGLLSVPEIAAAAGERMVDYHLHRLELAGLIEMQGEKIVLTEAGDGLQRAGVGAEGEGRGGQDLNYLFYWHMYKSP